ncbi:MAG: hypothetical protein JNK26_04090 [Candidatus Doudnabacteria bacterium]|nr:hypothetical protein [Candidatus Doudnabacteria bacterium]
MLKLARTQLKTALYTLAGAIVGGIVSDFIVRVATFDGYIEMTTVVRFIIIYTLILGLALSIALYAHNYPSDPVKHFALKTRRKSKTVRVGIFNDIPWTENEDTNHSWNNIKPEVWKSVFLENYLNNGHVIVDMVNTGSNLYEYDILVNPYGGLYKDSNLDKRPVLNKILDYVKEGGLYINVSDTPFYYTFREELGYRVESRIQGVYLGHPFPGQITPLTSELNFYCTQHLHGEISESFTDDYKYLELHEKPKIKMFRFAPVTGTGIKSIYEPVIRDGKEYSSLFFARYGDGSFLISLLPFYLTEETNINGEYQARWLKLIATLATSRLAKAKLESAVLK